MATSQSVSLMSSWWVLAVWWLGINTLPGKHGWVHALKHSAVGGYLSECVLELVQLGETGGIQQQRHLHRWSNARGICCRQLLQPRRLPKGAKALPPSKWQTCWWTARP